MPHSSYHHCHSVLFAKLNAVVVAHRAAGVNDCCDAGFVGHAHTVIEGEESI